MHHYRKTRKNYKHHNNNDTPGRCPFPTCGEAEMDSQLILFENKTMAVIANRISYDTFETLEVEEHLLVIPKRHLETFAEFTSQEMLDLMHIVSDYEQKGYSIYARGVGSINRSVKHQHTHLLKLKNKKANLLFYLRKPYFVAKL